MVSKFTEKRVVRYLTGGLLTACVELGTFVILEQFMGLNTNVAHTASYLLAIVVNYSFLKYWIFRDSIDSNTRHIIGYACVILINVTLSNVLISALASHLSPIGAKMVTMSFVILWNYLFLNRVVFRTKIN